MPPTAPAASPFWAAHVHADRRPFLLARNRIVAGLRGYFAEQDCGELETGVLQISPGNETHLHAFATTLTGPDGAARRARGCETPWRTRQSGAHPPPIISCRQIPARCADKAATTGRPGTQAPWRRRANGSRCPAIPARRRCRPRQNHERQTRPAGRPRPDCAPTGTACGRHGRARPKRARRRVGRPA